MTSHRYHRTEQPALAACRSKCLNTATHLFGNFLAKRQCLWAGGNVEFVGKHGDAMVVLPDRLCIISPREEIAHESTMGRFPIWLDFEYLLIALCRNVKM